nr:organic solute transporter Ost-alpha [Tanacetum cinerariifolium]
MGGGPGFGGGGMGGGNPFRGIPGFGGGIGKKQENKQENKQEEVEKKQEKDGLIGEDFISGKITTLHMLPRMGVQVVEEQSLLVPVLIYAETMEKRVEETEGSVRSLREGQQAIVNQINDPFSQLKVCIEEVSKRGNDGESSNGRGRGPRYGPNANYTAKPLKLDFSRFNGKEDPTSWVCRAE